MVSVSVAVAVFAGHAGSKAETVSVPVSTRVGVPSTAPAVASKVTPLGSALSVSCHAQGTDPPLQASVCA